MKKTQRQFVLNALKKDGKISRNQCLRRYISRLGAIIFELRREGFEITGGYKKVGKGLDYIYKLKK